MERKPLPSELLERGWTHGAMFRRNGSGKTVKMSYCLAGAAQKYGRSDKFQKRFLKMAGIILIEQGLAAKSRLQDVQRAYLAVMWNDTQGRTQEEVIALAKEVEARLGLVAETTPKPKPEVELRCLAEVEPAPEPEPEGDDPPFVVQEDRVLVGVGD